jgi:hypothetical protein
MQNREIDDLFARRGDGRPAESVADVADIAAGRLGIASTGVTHVTTDPVQEQWGPAHEENRDNLRAQRD